MCVRECLYVCGRECVCVWGREGGLAHVGVSKP